MNRWQRRKLAQHFANESPERREEVTQLARINGARTLAMTVSGGTPDFPVPALASWEATVEVNGEEWRVTATRVSTPWPGPGS